MSDYLVPEEILIEILLKLPVKSLIRFTSVCKQWGCLIRSPSFISTHLSNTEDQALVWRFDVKERVEHYMVIPKTGTFVITSDSSEFDFPFKSHFGGFFKIVGSCDGLVCFSANDYKKPEIIVWNPAIRNHLVLPQPLINPKFGVLGFGVGRNVYKVVRLVCYREPQAEIFCLAGTRSWRKLNGLDDVRFRELLCPIFFKGFLHWIAYDPTGENISERVSILRFHVGDEVFDKTTLPHELEWAALVRGLRLAVIGESLGAIKYDLNIQNPSDIGKPISCDVWMMKDYGVKESWTKLYTIDAEGLDIVIRVIGFWGSGEALLEVHRGELVTYNPETKGIKHVFGSTLALAFYNVNDYKESLVLLGGYSDDSIEGPS